MIQWQPPKRSGFTLVEALLAVTVTTVAGAALLTSVGAAVMSSTDAAHSAVGYGMAEAMLEEIAAVRFPTSESRPLNRLTRIDFDDIDDYAGWASKPPTNRTGTTLGTEANTYDGANARLSTMQSDSGFLASFTREVKVERLLPDAGNGWTVVSHSTNYRRVTVMIDYTDARSNTKMIAKVSRIFSYVSLAP